MRMWDLFASALRIAPAVSSLRSQSVPLRFLRSGCGWSYARYKKSELKLLLCPVLSFYRLSRIFSCRSQLPHNSVLPSGFQAPLFPLVSTNIVMAPNRTDKVTKASRSKPNYDLGIASLAAPIVPPSPEKKVGKYFGERSVAKLYPNPAKAAGASKRHVSDPLPALCRQLQLEAERRARGRSDPFESSSMPTPPDTPSRPSSPSPIRSPRKQRDPMEILFISPKQRGSTGPKFRTVSKTFTGASPQATFMFMPQTDFESRFEEKKSETGMPRTIVFGHEEGCDLTIPDAVSDADPGVPNGRRYCPVKICFQVSLTTCF